MFVCVIDESVVRAYTNTRTSFFGLSYTMRSISRARVKQFLAMRSLERSFFFATCCRADGVKFERGR